MIIVDSNAWAGFFNGAALPHVDRLDWALREEEDLAVLPIIVTEALQGFRTEAGFRRAQSTSGGCAEPRRAMRPVRVG